MATITRARLAELLTASGQNGMPPARLLPDDPGTAHAAVCRRGRCRCRDPVEVSDAVALHSHLASLLERTVPTERLPRRHAALGDGLAATCRSVAALDDAGRSYVLAALGQLASRWRYGQPSSDTHRRDAIAAASLLPTRDDAELRTVSFGLPLAATSARSRAALVTIRDRAAQLAARGSESAAFIVGDPKAGHPAITFVGCGFPLVVTDGPLLAVGGLPDGLTAACGHGDLVRLGDLAGDRASTAAVLYDPAGAYPTLRAAADAAALLHRDHR